MESTDINFDSRILETRPAEWRKFKFIQQDNFKELSEIDKQRLKTSIFSNGFLQPFYAWEHEGETYCLDGRHRVLALELLHSDGQSIPDMLQTTFMRIDDMQQAAKFVIIYSAHYAQITELGLSDFLETYNLDLNLLFHEISLPVLDILAREPLPIPENLIGEAKQKPATIKLTFENALDAERAVPLVEKLLKEFNGAFFSVSAGEI